MEYYFAPMEGVTGGEYRRAHHRYFSGIDRYYMPFVSPTRDHVFTQRELRNISPEANEGICAVPQLLTKEAEDFLWAAGELKAMGYGEVNLNVGCPSGTVVAKRKGAGMLENLLLLDQFLEEIFSRAEVEISVKTRLGMHDPEEFEEIMEVFKKYPISLLIIHPRVRDDFYKHPVRMEEFTKAAESYKGELCFNGGLVTAGGCQDIHKKFPNVEKIMVGQGLLANPALARQAKGGKGPQREELRQFHEELYQGYLKAFNSGRNTVFHMKELWSYQCKIFEGGEKLFKQIKKAQDTAAYESAVAQIFNTLEIREDAAW